MRIATAAGTLLLMATTATPATAAPTRPTPLVVPFSATAAFDETVDILTHGPMTLLLHCFNDAIGDVGRLAVVSTEQHMLIPGEPSVLMPADDPATLFFGSVPSPDGAGYVAANPTPTHFADFRGSGGAAITPSGFVLNVPADGVGFGIATYRFSITPHGWESAPDCFVTGTALLSKVSVLP